MDKEEYAKRFFELQRKKEIRRKKKYLGEHYYKMYPTKMKCRIHGKRRKERFMNIYHKLTKTLEDEERFNKRILKMDWHSEMVGKYNYFGNRWRWVLDIEYIPMRGGVIHK